MEQHKFVWFFRMNRSGKLEMGPNGITTVKYKKPEMIIKHNSELQNEMTLEIEGNVYIIRDEEQLSHLIEVINTRDTKTILNFTDCELEKVKQ